MRRVARTAVLALAMCGACSAPDTSKPFQWDALDQVAGASGSAGMAVLIGGAAGALAAAGEPSMGGAGGGSAGSGGVLATAGAATGEAGTGGAPVTTAFTGAPGYVSAPVTSSAAAQMTKSGTNPTKTQCLSCHNGTAGVKAFLAGGTVFSDLVRGVPAVDYEVRVVDTATNTVFSAHTDENGNFWIAAPAVAPGGPFMIGVRNMSHSQAMPVLQRGLECNGSACHGGMQGPVHVP